MKKPTVAQLNTGKTEIKAGKNPRIAAQKLALEIHPGAFIYHLIKKFGKKALGLKENKIKKDN